MMVEYPSCIDCLAADPERRYTRPRKIATAEGEPKRCASHLREFNTRQRKQARARQVERTYDITAEDNHALFLFQGGRCWLCRKATGATKSLAVDHDHATNEVRGRLCGPCNQFIGKLGDDPEAARRLVAYLTGDTPYRRLKATQTLTAAGCLVAGLQRVIEHGTGLCAIWSDGQRTSHSRVRDNITGVWSVTRD
jgi:hypothetical protein